MPQIAYREIRLGAPALALVEHTNEIATTYAAGGDSLTLRQLYYRFVAAGLLPNRDSEYKRLGSIINAHNATPEHESWRTRREGRR